MAAVKLACTCRAASASTNSHARRAMAHGTTAISPNARATTRTTTAAPPMSGRAPTSGQLTAGYAASANAAARAAPAVIKRARDARSGEIPAPPVSLAPAADPRTRPQPERQIIHWRGDEWLGRDFDDRQIEAAGPQIEQSADGSLVEQRRNGDDQRLRAEYRRRNELDLLPGVTEDDIGLDQGIDDAIALHESHRWLQPPQNASIADETNAIPPLQIEVGECRRRPHGLKASSFLTMTRLRERIEENDNVGVPLPMDIVHIGLAQPCGQSPVDPAQTVARHEWPSVGKLDTLAGRAREFIASEDLRLHWRHDGAHRLRAGVNAQRQTGAHPALADEKTHRIPRANEDFANQVSAPAAATNRVLQLADHPGGKRDEIRCWFLCRREPIRQPQCDLNPRNWYCRRELDVQY